MGAADVTEVWKKAATMMGETSSQVIVDATTPTKPVELTFDDLYDEIRTSMIKLVSPVFATRYEALREAPTHTPFGYEGDWGVGWNHVYREPADSIKFIGFVRDRYQRGFITDYKKALLPIDYKTLVSDSETAGVYTFNTRTSGLWLRSPGKNYHHFTLNDEYGLLQEGYVNDDDVSGADFFWYDKKTAGLMTNSVNANARGGSFWPNAATSDMSIDVNQTEWYWPTTTYPATLTLNIAEDAESSGADWSSNILTDRDEPIGVYLKDITDPTEWNDEFLALVTTELARKAAGVHAKSSKLIKLLTDERIVALSNAISQDAAEDDNLEGNRASTAEQARW